MKKIALVLLLAMALMTLASCGGTTEDASTAPYGVEEKFLGMWEQVSEERKTEGKQEKKEESYDSFAVAEPAEEAADEAYESYTFFMPNGTCIGFYRGSDDCSFGTDTSTWYTADPQFLQMGSLHWKYTFKGSDTLILTRVSGHRNYDDNYNLTSAYTATYTVTLKRSDKLPGELPQ